MNSNANVTFVFLSFLSKHFKPEHFQMLTKNTYKQSSAANYTMHLELYNNSWPTHIHYFILVSCIIYYVMP